MKGCLVFHIELQNTWDEFIGKSGIFSAILANFRHFLAILPNYCINVMKGRLVSHIELQNTWDEFIDKLLS